MWTDTCQEDHGQARGRALHQTSPGMPTQIDEGQWITLTLGKNVGCTPCEKSPQIVSGGLSRPWVSVRCYVPLFPSPPARLPQGPSLAIQNPVFPSFSESTWGGYRR